MGACVCDYIIFWEFREHSGAFLKTGSGNSVLRPNDVRLWPIELERS